MTKQEEEIIESFLVEIKNVNSVLEKNETPTAVYLNKSCLRTEIINNYLSFLDTIRIRHDIKTEEVDG